MFTGTKRGAGTDSNVFMTMYGSLGDSGERELRKSNNRNKFEDGQVDEFKVKAVDLGDLEKIKIGHDNSGFGAAWYLEKVEIFNPNSQRTYLFNCQNWLSKNEGDGKITRELPAIDPEMLRRVKFRDGAKDLKDQILLETEGLACFCLLLLLTFLDLYLFSLENYFMDSDDTGKKIMRELETAFFINEKYRCFKILLLFAIVNYFQCFYYQISLQ